MKYRFKLKYIGAMVLAGALLSPCFAAQEKPNIVLFYIDDWGWSGTPVHMDDSLENSFMPLLQMPNVERLAEQGMTFSNAYGSPQCAPARYCLQTGQSSPRNGYTLVLGNQPEGDYDTRKTYEKLPLIPNTSAESLAPDAVTIPKALKPLGYVCAHLGKWHLYSDPGAAGYAVNDGETTNSEGNTLPGGDKIPDDMVDPKLMFSITGKAIGFIEEQVKSGHPFYCQISHYAMHEGRECLPKTREKYVNLPAVQAWYKSVGKTAETINRKQDPAVWLAMGEDLDGRIGAVLDKLDELGIADNTYVVMVADNGYRHHELELTDLKQPLHGHKWWTWQGGIRVPMIVRGPEIQGGTTFDANVVNYDFLPTFLDWAGGDPSALQNIDGTSLAGFMEGEEPAADFVNRNLYFHLPHYRNEVPHSAIISGHNKVIHFYEHPEIPMMFDLSKDPSEVNNIASQNPETHKQLFDEMMTYLKGVGARFPKVNPDYDPEHYKTLKNYEMYQQWGPFKGTRQLEKDER